MTSECTKEAEREVCTNAHNNYKETTINIDLLMLTERKLMDYPRVCFRTGGTLIRAAIAVELRKLSPHFLGW